MNSLIQALVTAIVNIVVALIKAKSGSCGE